MKKLIYFAVLGMLTFSSCEDFLTRGPVSDLRPARAIAVGGTSTLVLRGVISVLKNILPSRMQRNMKMLLTWDNVMVCVPTCIFGVPVLGVKCR